VAFAGTLPSFVFTLVAGVISDRVDRRWMIIALQAVMMLLAFTLAALTLSGVVQFWHVLVLAALLGTANALEMPTRQSYLVEMVGREDLMNAIALNSSIFNMARVIGPAIAGVVINSIGEGPAFLANGVSFIAVIVGLLLIRTEPRPRAARAFTPVADFTAGLRYIRGQARIAVLIALVAVPSVCGYPYVSQLPLFADRYLGLGVEGYSRLLTATGIGALAAALGLATFSNFRRKGLLVTLGGISFAAGLLALSFVRDAWLASGLMVFLGWATVTQFATTNTLLQTTTDDSYRGRVMGVYLWTINGLAPFGQLGLATLASATSVPSAIAVGAAICLIFAAAVGVLRPGVRRMTG
jgi:MFS family permease